MKRLLVITINLILSIQVYSQNIDTLKISERLNKLEIENAILKAKVEAYNDNSSDILNTVSITIAILLGIFGLVNISQLIQNHRLNTKKLSEIEKSLIDKISKIIDNKVTIKVSGKFSELEQLKRNILELDILTLQNKCPSTNPQNIDIEIMNLIQLLGLSIKHYNYTKFDYHVNSALKGFITHLEKHSIPEYEKEKIYTVMKDLSSEFEFKKDKILKLLKDK